MEQWTLWLGEILIGWVTVYAAAYFAMKGKNRAVSENLKEMTRVVEEVKQENRLIIERLGYENRLRLAALDRRLQAYQDAYALWWDLKNCLHDRQRVGEAVMQCQDWWVRNNVYLDPEVRMAFVTAYSSAAHHRAMVDAHTDSATIESNWEAIMRPGQLIPKAVSLPSIPQDSDRSSAPPAPVI